MNESMEVIQQSLEQLIEAQECAEYEGDSEALEQIDLALKEYLGKEAAKTDSYAGAIRTLLRDAETCDIEAQRLLDRAKQKKALAERLKDHALYNLQRFNIRELKTPTNTIRRQANGGLEALDTSELTSAQWLNITVTLPALVWIDLLGLAQAAAPSSATYAMLTRLTEKAPRTPDTERIREALRQRIPCAECGATQLEGVSCPRCEGKGTIPNTVPGAKLLPRAEHVRVL